MVCQISQILEWLNYMHTKYYQTQPTMEITAVVSCQPLRPHNVYLEFQTDSQTFKPWNFEVNRMTNKWKLVTINDPPLFTVNPCIQVFLTYLFTYLCLRRLGLYLPKPSSLIHIRLVWTTSKACLKHCNNTIVDYESKQYLIRVILSPPSLPKTRNVKRYSWKRKWV